LRLQGLEVLDEPAAINDVFARSAVIVHHGGSMTNAVLAAGRPQILLPQHLEQVTTAQQAARLGVAAVLPMNAAPDAAGRALKYVLSERRIADQAMALAKRLHDRPRRATLQVVSCHVGDFAELGRVRTRAD
jgi:UDP:flavonoid glycosyltransferase YjiC (YdhE family)